MQIINYLWEMRFQIRTLPSVGTAKARSRYFIDLRAAGYSPRPLFS